MTMVVDAVPFAEVPIASTDATLLQYENAVIHRMLGGDPETFYYEIMPVCWALEERIVEVGSVTRAQAKEMANAWIRGFNEDRAKLYKPLAECDERPSISR